MDKLKYIPGDLVYFGGEKAKVEICNSNADDSIWIRVIENGGENRIWNASLKGEINPIPLTPEILEKNRWYGATYSKQSDDTTKILYKTFKRKGYPTIKASQDLKITCELSPFIVKLESVSDLQHLLFGLGINHEMEV